METIFFAIHATVTTLSYPEKNHCFAERVAMLKKPQYRMTCYDEENDKDVIIQFVVLDWMTNERLPIECLSKQVISHKLKEKGFHPYRQFKS